MVKPILLISACLEFDKVRYNGQSIPSEFVRDLIPFVEFIKVCPEYEIGLGVPREPIRIVKKDGDYRLIQHNTNKDVTDDMNNFSKKFISEIKKVDGFIFKSKSPTMGVKNIKVYSGMKGSPVIERCGGFFAGRVAEEYEGYPIEEEDRLRNKKIRDHFLTKLFLFARYRESIENKKIEEFHKNNKLLLKFYNLEIANTLDISDKEYFKKIKEILSKPPTTDAIIEFFRKIIGDNEFLEKFRNNIISFETLKEISKLLIKNKNMLKETFYNPYPKELIQNADQERDRDYWK
jgi:uncharacterized protein YbbK (DUF523 family)/uncharacterized protein YbgA (DUF1722 family)